MGDILKLVDVKHLHPGDADQTKAQSDGSVVSNCLRRYLVPLALGVSTCTVAYSGTVQRAADRLDM